MNTPSFNPSSINRILPLSLRLSSRRSQSGQVMILMSMFMLSIVIGFLALGLDFTMIYHTKAQLSRTVDSMALRLVNRYSKNHTFADRQRIAESIFEANFDLIRKTPPVVWNWVSDGGSINSARGETVKANGFVNGQRLYQLEINTTADDNTGVIVTKVYGTAEHRTLLLPLFSEEYKKFEFTEFSQTERFPSVNAIIIDLSGSMRGNGGAEGILGKGSSDGAVVQFIKEFDDARDYMMLVGFSNTGKVIWPPTAEGIDPDGIPFFKPSRGFLSGTGVTPDAQGNKTMEDVIEKTVRFTGWTNGGDGFVTAVRNVQAWLDTEPALQIPTIREKIKVNYVFMTDGDNNTYRTFVRGYGYGIHDDGSDDLTPPILSVHNTFHRDWPVAIHDPADLNAIKYNNRWLGKLLDNAVQSGQAPRPENAPGIAATVIRTTINDKDNRFARRLVNDNSSYEEWNNLLLKEVGGPDVSKIGPNYDSRVSTVRILKWDSNVKDKADLPSGEVEEDWVLKDDLARERSRVNSSNMLTIPRTISHGPEHFFLNPGRGWNYWKAAGSPDNPTNLSVLNSNVKTETETVNSVTRSYKYIERGPYKTRYYFLAEQIYKAYRTRFDSTTNSDTDMTNFRANYAPIGEVYANHMGSFVKREAANGSWAPNAASHPQLYQANSSKRRDMITQRIADFYPRYTLDGPPKQNRWSGASDTNTKTSPDRKYYDWQSGSWSTGIRANGGSNFLEGAQGYVVRKRDTTDPFRFQDATIYSIRYGSGSSNLLKELANDPLNKISGKFVAFPEQNEGAYYDVNLGATNLQNAFKSIASRIAVRIAK